MNLRNLSVLAYALGFTLWVYRAGEGTLASVEAAGFFSDAAGMFHEGDLIVVVGADGTRVRSVSIAGLEVRLQGLS